MPWTKQVNQTQTAKTGNSDLQGRFYFGDAAASPPNALRIELSVAADLPGGIVEIKQHDQAVANSSLTPAQRTTLAQLLGILRDDALTALGFVNTP